MWYLFIWLQKKEEEKLVFFFCLNLGNIRWPPGCSLRLISGAVLSQKEINLVDSLNPDEELDICVEMMSPKEPAVIQCQYRLFTPTGTPFGGK